MNAEKQYSPLSSRVIPATHNKGSINFADNRNWSITQTKLIDMIHKSERPKLPAQKKKENKTGLLDNQKSDIETPPGFSTDNVHIHCSSIQSSQFQPLAYAQRTGTHLPSGQDKHLSHKAYHVVQQKPLWIFPNGIIQRKEDRHRFNKGEVSINTEKTKSLSIYYKAGEEEKRAPCLHATIEYTPDATANDADPIRLIQVVQPKDRKDPKDTFSKWPAQEERRTKTRTEEGWFVDHQAEKLKPRNQTTDPLVPDAYVDAFFLGDRSFRQEAEAKKTEGSFYCKNFHGKKLDSVIESASLEDMPSSNIPYDFKAEVQIKGKEAEGDVVYGNLTWGFTTKRDGQLLVIDSVYDPTFSDHESPNFSKALSKFHEVYRNPGSAYSPEIIQEIKTKYANPPTPLEKIQARIQLAKIYLYLRRNAIEHDYHSLQVEEMRLIMELFSGASINQFTEQENTIYKEEIGKDIQEDFPEANVTT